MKHTLALVLMVFGLVGCASTPIDTSTPRAQQLMQEARAERLIAEEIAVTQKKKDACMVSYAPDSEARIDCISKADSYLNQHYRDIAYDARIGRDQLVKKNIYANLKQRCEDYGFTGESNISACIQREAQVDVALAKQQHEIDLLNQQAAAEAEDDTGDDFMDDLLSIFNTLENNKKDKRLKKAEAEVKARRRAERNRQSVCVLNRNC
tara:strand:+ start:302 stop:925 length:624 start_codon:yes stop_codon:yes gene_type:complete